MDKFRSPASLQGLSSDEQTGQFLRWFGAKLFFGDAVSFFRRHV